MIGLRYTVFAASMLGLSTPGVRAQTRPSPHPLGPAAATSSDSIGDARSIRPLSDGRVIVNDIKGRRLLLLDASLQHITVIADTTAATSRAYGKGLQALLSFAGDSSIIQDEITRAYLVIDPNGKIARVIPAPPSAPRIPLPKQPPPQPLGLPAAYDAGGHFLYASPAPYFLGLLPEGFVGDTLMVGLDSTALLRQSVGATAVDTLVSLKAPRIRQAVTRRGGRGNGRRAFNPIPSGDDWTVLNDGTIAVVRVVDYHVDWVGPDRRITSSPKIPTEWVRITPSMKVAIMDSVHAAESLDVPRGGRPANAATPPPAYVTPSDLPDVRPPFMSGFTRADAENRVWVRENQNPSTSSVIYDVIDRQGRLADRVQLPAASALAGFAPGAVYLTSVVQGTVRLMRVAFH
jgi:hypothetical protein